MTHTPGPWNYSPKTLLITGSDGYRLSDPIRPDATRLANTQLAAAAPDLLAACYALLEIVEFEYEHDSDPAELPSWKQDIDLAKAAIAKAGGAA